MSTRSYAATLHFGPSVRRPVLSERAIKEGAGERNLGTGERERGREEVSERKRRGRRRGKKKGRVEERDAPLNKKIPRHHRIMYV